MTVTRYGFAIPIGNDGWDTVTPIADRRYCDNGHELITWNARTAGNRCFHCRKRGQVGRPLPAATRTRDDYYETHYAEKGVGE